jgi:hypothetical protein
MTNEWVKLQDLMDQLGWSRRTASRRLSESGAITVRNPINRRETLLKRTDVDRLISGSKPRRRAGVA